MSRILNAVNKLLNPGMGGTGVLVATRDPWAIYGNPPPPANATPGAGALGDADEVWVVGTDANEISPCYATSDGTLVQTTTPVGTTSYTSKSFYTQGFARIVGTAFSNTAGSLNVDQSSDGVNWDVSTTTAVSAGTGTSFSVEVVAPYARVRFAGSPTQVNATLRIFPWLRRI
jgi:hypothetical protein